MAKRQKLLAARVRDALFDTLGRRCSWCGATDHDEGKDGPPVKLTFDCIIPTFEGHKSDHHRRYDWSWRMSFYRQQHAAGNLQVLCDHCNSAKGQHISFHESDDFDLPPLIAALGAPF